MAVARYSTGTVAPVDTEVTTSITVETEDGFGGVGGSNRAILVLLELDPSGSAPTSLSVRWYYDGTNYQTMTLIESWNSGGVYFYTYGLVNANTHSGNYAIVASWTNNCYPLIYAQSLTGVKQTSVATAFTNATHASGTGSVASVTIASATGDMVFAHHNAAAGDLDEVQDSILYDKLGWPDSRSPVWNSGGNYASGAASVTLDCNIYDAAWRSQGVNVVAAVTSHTLTATNLTVGSPALGTPALGVVVNLAAVGCEAGSPSIDAPELSVEGAVNLTVGSPAIDAALLTQEHALVAADLVSTVAAIDASDLVVVKPLVAAGLAVAAPVLSAAALGQRHELTASDKITGSPVLGQPAASMVQELLPAVDLAVGAPVLSEGVVAFVDILPAAVALAVGRPAFSVDEWPSIHYDIETLIDPETGLRRMIMLFTNYNAQARLKVRSGLVGAGDEITGWVDVHRIAVTAPLILIDDHLYVDLEALFDGVFAKVGTLYTRKHALSAALAARAEAIDLALSALQNRTGNLTVGGPVIGVAELLEAS